MTKDQRKYAAQRVDKILKSKLDNLREKHTVSGVTLTREQREEAVEKGEFVVKGLTSYRNDRLDIEFPEESDDVFDEEAFNSEAERVRDEADSIKDQLFLGDSEQALELIQSFDPTV